MNASIEQPRHSGTAQAPASLTVLDPSLRDVHSHHHVINSNLHKTAPEYGFALEVIAHRSARSNDFAYNVAGVFRHGVYEDKPTLSEADYQAQVRKHFDDLCTVFSSCKGTAIVVHTATSAFLQALGLMLLELRPRVNAVVVQLMFHPLSFALPEDKLCHPRSRYTVALRTLKKFELVSGVPVSLATSCMEFSGYFSGILGQTVPIHPYALSSRNAAVVAARIPTDSAASMSSRRVLLFAGDPKIDKGLRWIANCLPRLLDSFADTRFVIHLGPNRFDNPQLAEIFVRIRALSVAHRNLSLIEGHIDQHRWDELIGGMDMVVIPYSRDAYANKTSGIYWESLSKIRPEGRIVVTRGSWMQRESEAWGLDVKTCEYGNSEELHTLISAIDTLECIGSLERENREFWSRFFAQGNDDFMLGQLK